VTPPGAQPASGGEAQDAHRAPACTLVIFGAAGDLARRLLMPAVTTLAGRGLLDDGFRVLGVDRVAGDDDSFRRDWRSHAGAAPLSRWLADRLFYQVGDLEDGRSFERLAARLRQLGGGDGGSAVFYLAVAPRFFGETVDRLAASGLSREPGECFRRVVIEKPFGVDYPSARALNQRILKSLDETQIYRMDHFLGKETVRNIMVARFGNSVFEPLWSRTYIDHVQIMAAETVGVEHRGGYYDATGALRDMTPNHLFQLLELVAMERPASLEASAILKERSRAVAAVKVQSADEAAANAVFGQYGAGECGGKPVPAYRQSPDVDSRSRTETYVALKLAIDNARWSGVPFYLRTGKAMSARDTEIAIRFKPTASLFDGDWKSASAGGNLLVLQIQPEEGIALHLAAKRPGLDLRIDDVRMDFLYRDYFEMKASSGYETLIYDCLAGDRTLFPGAEAIERAWRAVAPFLEARKSAEIHAYPAGADGPAAADGLPARDGRKWRPVGSSGERRAC
jgi:glucose-6-phosphate 1-dehydrogenase